MPRFCCWCGKEEDTELCNDESLKRACEEMAHELFKAKEQAPMPQSDQELLDMFACAAMQGMMTSPAVYIGSKTFGEIAYDVADELLTERKKRYDPK